MNNIGTDSRLASLASLAVFGDTRDRRDEPSHPLGHTVLDAVELRDFLLRRHAALHNIFEEGGKHELVVDTGRVDPTRPIWPDHLGTRTLPCRLDSHRVVVHRGA